MVKQIKLDMFLTEEEKVEEEAREKEEGPYDLPDGWKWVRIKNIVVNFQSGFPCAKRYATEKGIPHLRPNNIGFYGRLDLSRLVFIPPEEVDLNKYSLRKGDVLFNNTNSKELVGRACLIKEDLEYAFSNHITRLRVNKQFITPEWLSWSINYLWLKGYFLSICRKWIGQAGVNTRMLKSTKIPLPPLEEQKRIVARLEELVNRVEEAKRLRRLAKEEAEKIMQAALNKVFSKAEERGWKWVRLRDVAKVVGGHTPRRNVPEYWNGDVPWLTPTELPSDAIAIISDSKKKITQEGLKNSSAVLIPPGSVLYTSRATIGKVAIAGVPLATNQGFTNFICTNRVYNWYLAYCLKWLTPQIKREAGRTTFKEVKRSRFKTFKIPIPPMEEQKRIVQYLNEISKNIKSLGFLQQKTEEELEKLIPTILDKAFKGEL